MQAQFLSQKLYLHLREVTLGWQKQKISLKWYFQEHFLKSFAVPLLKNCSCKEGIKFPHFSALSPSQLLSPFPP